MQEYKFQWLVEVSPSPMTEKSATVYVVADECVLAGGALLFLSADPLYLICAFAPGQWFKCEITETLLGLGNGMFRARVGSD